MATEIPDVVVIGESGICLASGDLNGDGLPDLLVPVGTAAVSLLGDGTGGFTQKGSVTLATGGFFTLGDFNHDGKLDLATSGNLLAYGNGDGTFQTPTPFVPNAPPSGFYYIASGDLNGDGWADIVLSNVFDFYVYILINDHKGSFDESVIQFPAFTYQPDQIALADVNGDGNLDAVFSDGCCGLVVLLGDGTGHLTVKQEIKEPLGSREARRCGWRT